MAFIPDNPFQNTWKDSPWNNQDDSPSTPPEPDYALSTERRTQQETALWNQFQSYLPRPRQNPEPIPERTPHRGPANVTRRREINYQASERTPAHFNRERSQTTRDTSVGALRAMEAQQAETDRGTWYPNVGKMLWNLPGSLVETGKFIYGAVSPANIGERIGQEAVEQISRIPGVQAVRNFQAGIERRLFGEEITQEKTDWFTQEQKAIGAIGSEIFRFTFPRRSDIGTGKDPRESFPIFTGMIDEYAALNPISPEGPYALSRHLEEEPDILLDIALSATGIGLATAGVRHGIKAGRRIARAADRTLSPFSADVLDPVRAAHVDIEVLGKRQWTLDRNFGHRETLSTGMGTHLGEGRVSTALHVVAGHGTDGPLNLSGARVMLTDRQGRRIRAHGVQGMNIESDLALLHAENLRTPALNLETLETPDRATQRITSPYSTTGTELGLSQRRGQAGESGAGYITETGEFGVYLGEFEDSAQGIFATRQNLLNLQNQQHPFIAFSDFDTTRAASQLERYGLHYQHSRGTARVEKPKLHSGRRDPFQLSNRLVAHQTTEQNYRNILQRGAILSPHQTGQQLGMTQIDRYAGDSENVFLGKLPSAAGYGDYGLIFPTEPLIERYNARISQSDLIPDYVDLEQMMRDDYALQQGYPQPPTLWHIPSFRHRFRDATRRLQESERLTGRPALNLYDTEPFIEMTVPNQVPIDAAVGVVQANRKFLITPETRGPDFQRWQLEQFPNRLNLHSGRERLETLPQRLAVHRTSHENIKRIAKTGYLLPPEQTGRRIGMEDLDVHAGDTAYTFFTSFRNREGITPHASSNYGDYGLIYPADLLIDKYKGQVSDIDLIGGYDHIITETADRWYDEIGFPNDKELPNDYWQDPDFREMFRDDARFLQDELRLRGDEAKRLFDRDPQFLKDRQEWTFPYLSFEPRTGDTELLVPGRLPTSEAVGMISQGRPAILTPETQGLPMQQWRGDILNLHSGRRKQRYGTQTLYHATRPENVQSILEHGLDPTRSRGKRQEVYLFTPSREQWAREHIQEKYGVPPDEVPIFQAEVDRSQLTRRWRGIWSTPEHITPDKIVRLHSGRTDRLGMEHITRNKQSYQSILETGELRSPDYTPNIWLSMGPHYRSSRNTEQYGFIFPASAIERYNVTPYNSLGGFPEWEAYKERHLTKEVWEYEKHEIETHLKNFMQSEPFLLEKSHRYQFGHRGYSEFTIDRPLPIREAGAVIENDLIKIITPETRGLPSQQWHFREPTPHDFIPIITDIDTFDTGQLALGSYFDKERTGIRLHSGRPPDGDYVPDYDIDYDVDIPVGMPKVREIERPPTVTPPAPPQRLTGQQQLEILRARSVGTAPPDIDLIPPWRYAHALRETQIKAHGQDLSRLGADFDFSEPKRRRPTLSPAQRLERWWFEKSIDTGVGAMASQNFADATQAGAIIGVAAETAWEGTQAILGNDVNLGGFVRAGVEAGVGYAVNRWNRRYTQMPRDIELFPQNIGQAPPDARQNLERLFREAGAGTYRWRKGALDDLLHTYSDAELKMMLGGGGAEYLRDYAEIIRQFGQRSYQGQRDWGQTVQGLLSGDFGGSTRYVYSPEDRTVTPTQSTQWSVDEMLERYGDKNILLSAWKERRREIREGERTDWLGKIGLPLQTPDAQPNAFSMILPEKRIIGQLFNRYKAERQFDDIPVQDWTAKDWLLRNWGLQDFATGIGAQKWAENIGRRKQFRADRDVALEHRRLNPELYEWQDPDHFFRNVAERFGIDATDFQGFGADRLGSPYHRWGRFGANLPRQAKYPLIGAAAAGAGYIGYQAFFGGDNETLHLNRPENYAMSIRYPLLGAVLRSTPIRRLRARGENLLDAVYGDGTFHAEMMKSIVLGEKRNLPEEVTEIYEQTGQVHALVQSGMHVNMFGGLLRRYPFLGVPAAISTLKDTLLPPDEVVEPAQTGAWDRYNIFQLNPNPRMERWNPRLPSRGEIQYRQNLDTSDPEYLPRDYEVSFDKPWWGWWDPEANYEIAEDRRRRRKGAGIIPGGGYLYELKHGWSGKQYFGVSTNDPAGRRGRWQQHMSGKGSKAIAEELTLKGGDYTSQDFLAHKWHFPEGITYYQLGQWERKLIADFDTQRTGYNRSPGGEIRDPNYEWKPRAAQPFIQSDTRLRDIVPWATYTAMGVLPEAVYTYQTAERTQQRQEMDAYLFPKSTPLTQMTDTSVGAFRAWEAEQQEQVEAPDTTELIWSAQEETAREGISEQEKLLLLLSETTGNEQIISEITERVLEELAVRQRSRYTDP